MVYPLLAHTKVVFNIATLVHRLISSVSTFYENGKLFKDLSRKMQLYEEYIEVLRTSNITQKNETKLEDMKENLENLKVTISSIVAAHRSGFPRAAIAAPSESLTLENATLKIALMIIRVERLVINSPNDPLNLCTEREGIQTDRLGGNSSNDNHSLSHNIAPSSSRFPSTSSETSIRNSVKNKFRSAGRKIIIINNVRRFSKHHKSR